MGAAWAPSPPPPPPPPPPHVHYYNKGDPIKHVSHRFTHTRAQLHSHTHAHTCIRVHTDWVTCPQRIFFFQSALGQNNVSRARQGSVWATSPRPSPPPFPSSSTSSSSFLLRYRSWELTNWKKSCMWLCFPPLTPPSGLARGEWISMRCFRARFSWSSSWLWIVRDCRRSSWRALRRISPWSKCAHSPSHRACQPIRVLVNDTVSLSVCVCVRVCVPPMCPHVCSPPLPICSTTDITHVSSPTAPGLWDLPPVARTSRGWNKVVNDRRSERGKRVRGVGEAERVGGGGGGERERGGRERQGATWRLSAAERLNRRGGAGLQLCQLLMCCPLVCGLLTDAIIWFCLSKLACCSPRRRTEDRTEAYGAFLTISPVWCFPTAEPPLFLPLAASIQAGAGERERPSRRRREQPAGGSHAGFPPPPPSLPFFFFTCLRIYWLFLLWFLFATPNCTLPLLPTSALPDLCGSPESSAPRGAKLCIKASRIPQAASDHRGQRTPRRAPGADMPRRKQQAPRRSAGTHWLRFACSFPLSLSLLPLLALCVCVSPLLPASPIHLLFIDICLTHTETFM